MNRTKIILTLFVLIFLLNSNILIAQNTFLDSTFNSSGKVLLSIGNSIDYVTGIDIQSDGKIIAAGNSVNGTDNDFAVARFNTNGSLDNSFGNLGINTATFGISNDNCSSIKIQNDGKIILVGTSEIGNIQHFALIRYSTTGIVDSSFGNNGKVLTAIADTTSFANKIIIQNDGKIVIAGYSASNIGGYHDFAMIRYHNNGSIDSSFGINGIVTTDINSSYDNAQTLAIQTDGKLLLAGGASNGVDYDLAVVRYNTDGSLDLSFGVGGKQITPVGNHNDSPNSIAVQNDGKILLAGGTYNGTDYDYLIVRYNSNGNLDTTFGNNGIVIHPIGNSNEISSSILVQNDGKIILGGYTFTDTAICHFALSRYNNTGNLDSTFGDNGIIISNFGYDNEVIYSIAFQNDGKIIAGGSSGNVNNNDFAVARYKSSYTLGIANYKYGSDNFHFSPNPFNIQTNLKLSFCPKNATLIAFNDQGQVVKTILGINKTNISFTRGILKPGNYYIKLYENNQLLLTDKITINN